MSNVNNYCLTYAPFRELTATERKLFSISVPCGMDKIVKFEENLKELGVDIEKKPTLAFNNNGLLPVNTFIDFDKDGISFQVIGIRNKVNERNIIMIVVPSENSKVEAIAEFFKKEWTPLSGYFRKINSRY